LESQKKKNLNHRRTKNLGITEGEKSGNLGTIKILESWNEKKLRILE
jgi:hypothetical protein